VNGKAFLAYSWCIVRVGWAVNKFELLWDDEQILVSLGSGNQERECMCITTLYCTRISTYWSVGISFRRDNDVFFFLLLRWEIVYRSVPWRIIRWDISAPMIMVLAHRFVMLVAQPECHIVWCGCVVVASARLHEEHDWRALHIERWKLSSERLRWTRENHDFLVAI
jgi:hypothetical protein